jgi:hypothetical protein
LILEKDHALLCRRMRCSRNSCPLRCCRSRQVCAGIVDGRFYRANRTHLASANGTTVGMTFAGLPVLTMILRQMLGGQLTK